MSSSHSCLCSHPPSWLRLLIAITEEVTDYAIAHVDGRLQLHTPCRERQSSPEDFDLCGHEVGSELSLCRTAALMFVSVPGNTRSVTFTGLRPADHVSQVRPVECEIKWTRYLVTSSR